MLRGYHKSAMGQPVHGPGPHRTAPTPSRPPPSASTWSAASPPCSGAARCAEGCAAWYKVYRVKQGVRHDLGGAAGDAIKGLSGSPMLLLVAILNIAMLGLLYYVGASQREERAELTKYLIDCQRAPP